MDSRSHSTKQKVKHVWDQEVISSETQVAVHNCSLRTANMAARPHENPQQRSNHFKQLCPGKKCWGTPRLFNFIALEVVLKQRRNIVEPERRADTARNRTMIYWDLSEPHVLSLACSFCNIIFSQGENKPYLWFPSERLWGFTKMRWKFAATENRQNKWCSAVNAASAELGQNLWDTVKAGRSDVMLQKQQ